MPQAMKRKTFGRFKQLVYDNVGIALGPKKEALVCARVGKRMRVLDIGDYESYLDYLAGDETGEELIRFLDAICTNVTSFFREASHFDFLHSAVSEWLAHGLRRFRFWSAGCSTGEEAYSMAMTLIDACDGCDDVDWRILATDISTRALDRCLEGVYEAERTRTVPPWYRQQYLERSEGRAGVSYRVRDEVKQHILFRRLNLSTGGFPLKGPLDAIFCRNVMIYFDNPVRQRMLTEMYRLLKPGGFLMVGHAESLTGMMSPLETVRPALYVRPE